MVCPHLAVFFFFSTAAWYQGGISATQQGGARLRRYEGLKRSLVLHIVALLLVNFTVPVSDGRGKKQICISDRFIRESMLAGEVSE